MPVCGRCVLIPCVLFHGDSSACAGKSAPPKRTRWSDAAAAKQRQDRAEVLRNRLAGIRGDFDEPYILDKENKTEFTNKAVVTQLSWELGTHHIISEQTRWMPP